MTAKWKKCFAISTVLLATWLTTGCGEIKEYVSYLFESKEAKANRDSEMAQRKSEADRYGVAVKNCVSAVRQNTDPTTLQFDKRMHFDRNKTDNGWKVVEYASDINGSYTFTCYTDENGTILKATRNVEAGN